MIKFLDWIINSLLEIDLYKFSMGQCIFHQFTDMMVTWSFKCRNKNVYFTEAMVDEIKRQIDHYCTLKFEDNELIWLKEMCPWIRNDYIEFLRLWHPNRNEIYINSSSNVKYNDCGLTIEARGTWLSTSMYEIPILAIVNEVYFAYTGDTLELNEVFQNRTIQNFHNINKFSNVMVGEFSEFGLRRRYSGKMQDWLINYILNESVPYFVGTSNVFLAKKYGIKAVGTMAHEFIMAVGQGYHEYNPAYSNKFALKAWVKEYGVLNGIALTDTVTTELFLKDFDLTLATLFKGVRHDSGDPIYWGERMIDHYSRLGINPKDKTLLFSDSLNFKKAIEIRDHFKFKTNVAFGIGTFLSNPLDNPLNIVMKVTEANGYPVAKISDAPGKSMCKDKEYEDYLQRCINWRLSH